MDDERQKTCEERIEKEYAETIAYLRKIWAVYNGEETDDDEIDEHTFPEYGLDFSFVEPDNDDERGYFRYQLSWGGPSDEFRFYTDARGRVHAVEYVFMDWFDGAKKIVLGEDLTLMHEIFNFFEECGSVGQALSDCG